MAPMTGDQVPAELADRGREALARHLMTIPRQLLPTFHEQTRAILTAVLPAAYDMWRETAINDAARILIHGCEDGGLRVVCVPCKTELIKARASADASYVLAAVLGHLASEQHTNRTTKEN